MLPFERMPILPGAVKALEKKTDKHSETENVTDEPTRQPQPREIAKKT